MTSVPVECTRIGKLKSNAMRRVREVVDCEVSKYTSKQVCTFNFIGTLFSENGEIENEN